MITGYVNLQDNTSLPVFDSSGNPKIDIPTSQPAEVISTPFPLASVANADNDSLNNPSVSVEFSPLGTRQFSFSSDLSQPEGDEEDWVEVIPYGPHPGEVVFLAVSYSCFGNGSIEIQLFQAGQEIEDWGILICGENTREVSLIAGSNYQFRLGIVGKTETSYIAYTFTVKTSDH